MDEQIKILCVDDEPNVLRALQRVFLDNDYEMLTAESVDKGLEILHKEYPIQIVISDYRMPAMNGVDFLKEVCKNWPDTIRIVLSGYADTAAIVEAINEGQIYKFIPKPWNDDDLKVTISNAIEKYFLRKKNKQLTEKLKLKNEELLRINDNLERLVDERTRELSFQNKVLKRAHNILDSMPIAVLGIDPDGLIVFSNKMGRELFGSNNKDIIGKERINLLPEELNKFIDEVIKDKNLSGRVVINNETVDIKGTLMEYSEERQEGIILIFEKVGKDA